MILRSITFDLLLLPFAPFWGSITLSSCMKRFEAKISWLFSDEKRLSSGKNKKTGFLGNEKTHSNWKKAPLLKKIEKIRYFFANYPIFSRYSLWPKYTLLTYSPIIFLKLSAFHAHSHHSHASFVLNFSILQILQFMTISRHFAMIDANP